MRHSKYIIQQQRDNGKDGLHLIAALVAKETAEVPDLVVKTDKLANGMVGANLNLQLNKWGCKGASKFAGAVIDEKTGNQMEYRNLMKNQSSTCCGPSY